MQKRNRALKEAFDEAKVRYEKQKLKEASNILDDLRDGDKILANGEELYVCDANLSDDYCWVTDEASDRLNRKASGWSLQKYRIDKIIEHADSESNNEMNESIEPDKKPLVTKQLRNTLVKSMKKLQEQGIRLTRSDVKSILNEILKTVDESLGNTLTEELDDVPPAPQGNKVGVVELISMLIQEELTASDHYNSAIATMLAEKQDDIAEMLTEIRADEESHVGVLHTAKAMLDDQAAKKFSDGQEEANEILSSTDNNNDEGTKDLGDI